MTTQEFKVNLSPAALAIMKREGIKVPADRVAGIKVKLSDAALENIHETGADVAKDLLALMEGEHSQHSLLTHCLDGADEDRVVGWNDYADALATAATVFFAGGLEPDTVIQVARDRVASRPQDDHIVRLCEEVKDAANRNVGLAFKALGLIAARTHRSYEELVEWDRDRVRGDVLDVLNRALGENASHAQADV